MVREGAKKDSRRVKLTSVTMDATVAMSADRNRRILSVFAAVSNPQEYKFFSEHEQPVAVQTGLVQRSAALMSSLYYRTLLTGKCNIRIIGNNRE